MFKFMFKFMFLMGCVNFMHSSLSATSSQDSLNMITYTPEEMSIYRSQCQLEMSSNIKNQCDSTYQMSRALRTLLGDDTDYIPKVEGAGDIFLDENGIRYQRMHNGVKIVVNSYYDCQWLTDVIHGLRGHHEPQEEKCFYEILKYMPPNATMIELGAYWSYYSLWFSSEVEGANNYMVEPDPRRLEIGKRNFDLNNRTGKFFRGYLGNIVDTDPDLNGAECISLDDFLEREGIEHVNILHADIQGSEFAMLNSALKHLHEIDYFVISTHGQENAHLPCIAFFERHDCIILAEHSHFESCSGDGLVVAKRRGVLGPDSIPIKKY